MPSEPTPAARTVFAGNQPTFLPWLGLMEQMAFSDVFVLCDDFQLSTPSWHNRNKIKGPKGVAWLRIPVKHAHDQPINATELDDSQKWRKKHLRSIESNYRKAPYFETYWPDLQTLYESECSILSDFTIPMMRYFTKALDLKVSFILSSQLQLEGRKAERAIDLCHKVDCNVAYVAAGTQAYIDTREFKQQGVEVLFQDYTHPVYPQLWGEFISHLGVLDLLMNCGPDSRRVLLSTSQVIKKETYKEPPVT